MALVPGTFRGKAVNWQFGKAQTGTEQIVVQFELLDGPAKGERHSWYGTFGEKSTQRTLESLEHCGWDGDSLMDLKGMGTKEPELSCGEDEYKGEKRIRINWVNAPGGGMAMHEAYTTPDQKAAFAARMKGELLRFRQNKGNKTPASADTSFPHGANAGDKPPV